MHGSHLGIFRFGFRCTGWRILRGLPREQEGGKDPAALGERGEAELEPGAMGAPRLREKKMRTKLFSGSSPQLSSLAKPKSPGAWCQDFCRSQKWNENQALIKDLIHRKGLGMESQKP